jgi:hypothetical protein
MEEIDLIDLVTELLLHIQQKTGFIVYCIVYIGNMPEIRAVIWKFSEAISNANRQQENEHKFTSMHLTVYISGWLIYQTWADI